MEEKSRRQSGIILLTESAVLAVGEYIIGSGFGLSLPGILFACVFLVMLTGLAVNVILFVARKEGLGEPEAALTRFGLASVIIGAAEFFAGFLLGFSVPGFLLAALIAAAFVYFVRGEHGRLMGSAGNGK